MATYTQIECARLVERVRAIRDTYRDHLDHLGCRPLEEMYGVVFEYAVKDWAVRILRLAIREYIGQAGVRIREWEEVFGPLGTVRPLSEFELEFGTVGNGPELGTIVDSRIKGGCFEVSQEGGPFGRSASASLGRRKDGETSGDAATRIEALWDKYSVWTEPLASMFDVLQRELLYQAELLPKGEYRSSALYLPLNVFEQVVNKHLVSLRSDDTNDSHLGEQGWMELVRELDSNKVALDEELPATAKKLLLALRRKRIKIESWERAYSSRQPVSLDDGKSRSLHQQVRTHIHNTAKRVRRLLEQTG